VAFDNPAPLLAATLWLNGNKATLSTSEKVALRTLGNTVKTTGFSKLILVKPLNPSPAARSKMIAAQRFITSIVGKSVTTATTFSALASGMDIKLSH
jgi:hypothetical protein